MGRGLTFNTYNLEVAPQQIGGDDGSVPRMARVVCGYKHAMAATENGALYTWGKDRGTVPELMSFSGVVQVTQTAMDGVALTHMLSVVWTPPDDESPAQLSVLVLCVLFYRSALAMPSAHTRMRRGDSSHGPNSTGHRQSTGGRDTHSERRSWRWGMCVRLACCRGKSAKGCLGYGNPKEVKERKGLEVEGFGEKQPFGKIEHILAGHSHCAVLTSGAK